MKTTRQNHAMSIVEVAVAIGVLGVGLFVVAEIFRSSQVGATRAALQTKAYGLATLKLEELRASAATLESELRKSGTSQFVHPGDGWKPFAEDPRFGWRAEISRIAGESPIATIRVAVGQTDATPPAVISEVTGYVLFTQGGAQ